MTSEKASTSDIEERLAAITRLLAAMLVKDPTKKDAVLALSGVGLAPKAVGSILGPTNQQVSVILYDAKQSAAKQAEAMKG